MKLYIAPRAPNPRRVQMFMAEKGITGIEQVHVDLNGGEHRSDAFLAKSPLAKVPALELDDEPDLKILEAISPATLPANVMKWLNPQQRLSYYFSLNDGATKPPGDTAAAAPSGSSGATN